MHALLTTYRDFSRALERATGAPTLADAHKWGIAHGRYRHFLWAVEATWGLREDLPIHEAKAFLEYQIGREKSKRGHGHWSFDPNRLKATRQMLDHLRAYEESERAR